MNEEKIREVFSDEAFVKGLLEKEAPEEVQAALKGKGLDLSLEEIGKVRDGLAKVAAEGGELSADQLEDVAGGFAITLALVGAIASVVGAAAGLASMTHTVSNRRW